MRRIKVVFAVAMLLVAMLAASAAPAMANDNNRDTRLDRKDLRADRQLLRDLNNDENEFFFRPAFFGLGDVFDHDEDNDIDTFNVGGTDCFTVDNDVFCVINGTVVRVT